MIKQTDRAGTFLLPGTSMTVNRIGYGAMQLADPEVWGPPRDVDAAIPVLREAVDSIAATTTVPTSPISLSNGRFILIAKNS